MMELHLDLDCPSSASAARTSKAIARQQRKQAKKAASGYTNRDGGGKHLAAQNANQAALLGYLQETPVVFATGPEGTGKTYISSRVAIKKLMAPGNGIDRVIITRPTSSPDRHRMGFLPGNAAAKMAPWVKPMFDAFKDETSAVNIDKWVKEGKIEILPFEHMRGASLDNAVILGDEMQNCIFSDLKLLVTRVGKNSQVIIMGDAGQSDIGSQSALEEFIHIAEHYGVDSGVVRFTEYDVVRSEVASQWVRAISAYRKQTIH